jgi:hypothetical protein
MSEEMPDLTPEDIAALPDVEESQYPPNCKTDVERIRFRLALGIARKVLQEEDGSSVWHMTRAIYTNPDLPTG